MKLYFQAGKSQRLAIDTKIKGYCNDYWVLGAHKHYMKITMREMQDLMLELTNENYVPVKNIR